VIDVYLSLNPDATLSLLLDFVRVYKTLLVKTGIDIKLINLIELSKAASMKWKN